MLTLHGKDGQHARDISRRGLFETTHENDHAVVVPIAATRYVITALLQEGAPSSSIVNLSGIMNTSPNGIHNIHFLFGPNAIGSLSVATAGKIAKSGRIILDNAEKDGMKIIETTREEHDKKMAIIQGLSNFLLVLIGETQDDEIQKTLIVPWKTTTDTIRDMIFQNPPMEYLLQEFFDTLEGNGNNPLKAFGYLVEKYITSEDIAQFATPNFKRILDVLGGTIQIVLTPGYIQTFRNLFEKNGFHSLGERVQRIRLSQEKI